MVQGQAYSATIVYVVAKRFNRTITKHVRFLLFDPGIPKRMWYDKATYLINRSPTVSIEGFFQDTKSKTEKAGSKEPTALNDYRLFDMTT